MIGRGEKWWGELGRRSWSDRRKNRGVGRRRAFAGRCS
jgi:hypothetical protein